MGKVPEGLFNDPYRELEEAERICSSEEHKALALEGARESILLLKNGRVTVKGGR
ncbi:MAG: hypothetical protein ACP5T2_05965 [Thermoprotei archaeon]